MNRDRYKELMEAFDGSLSAGVIISEVLVGDNNLGPHRGTARLLIVKAMRDAYAQGFKVGRGE